MDNCADFYPFGKTVFMHSFHDYNDKNNNFQNEKGWNLDFHEIDQHLLHLNPFIVHLTFNGRDALHKLHF